MTASPDIRPALAEAYVATFGKPPRLGLQVISFEDTEVTRYGSHGIAEAEITVFRDSAIVEAIIDLQALQAPTSAWVSRYHPESLTIYVASGKQPIRLGARRFDETRVCEGLLINLHRHGFEHRRIPFTVELIPIYLPSSPSPGA